LTTLEIAHERDEEGFTDNWYDMIDTDDQTHDFYFTLPATVTDDMYVTVETYSQDIIPNECSGG